MRDSVSGEVAEMYDSPAGQIGPLLFGGHLHWGYWDATNAEEDFASGAEKLARMMIDRVTIKPGQRFVDLGCGVGVPAMKLVEAKKCRVDGITISEFQQQDATERALKQGLQEQARFIHASALAVPSADATYDGGWFFESIFHMGHREALLEANRILKPGATLVLTDLPVLASTSADFMAFVKEHIHSSFIDKEDYPSLMEETGFELLAIEDITRHVMPQLVPKFKQTLDAHKTEIYANISDITEKAIDDWVYLFEYMSENLGYMIVTARKK